MQRIIVALAILAATKVNAGVVLLYHHVDESTPAITSISPDQFVRHLNILEEERFEILPLNELVAESMATPSDARHAAITFDDAYISIYTTAYPELKRRGWPFTIFVAPAFVSDFNPHYLSWEQIHEMSQNGATIANHTVNHHHLIRRLDDEDEDAWQLRVSSEITVARDILKNHGHDSALFAYPYGEYDLPLLDIVSGLGFTAFGQQSGAIGPYSNPQLLPRFPLAGVYVGESAFRDKIKSLAMPIAHPDVDPLVGDDLHPELILKFLDGATNARVTCYAPGGAAELTRVDTTTLSVRSKDAVPVGRSRYNCTQPKGNRFHWFSQLWIRKNNDGSWYPEP